MSNLLETHALFTLYNSFCVPYLSYCCVVWGNTYKTRLNPLFVLQKKAIHTVCKINKYTPTTKLFYTLCMFKLKDIVEYNTLILMFKSYKNQLPNKIQPSFTSGNRHSNFVTGQKSKFIIHYVCTSLKSHCISSAGPKLWNKLPESLRNCNNLSSFKSKCKQHILSSYSES